MAKAYASAIIRAPVGAVCRVVRESTRCRRGLHVRERLAAFDVPEHRVTYNFEKTAFPVISNEIFAEGLKALSATLMNSQRW